MWEVLYEDGKRFSLPKETLQKLRLVWEKTRTTHTPPEGREVIDNALKEIEEKKKPTGVANNDNSTMPPSAPETSAGQQ
jgi:hypothetical protein